MFPQGKALSVFHSPHLSLRVDVSYDGNARISAVIGNTVEKTAVARHRFKRCVYDTVRLFEKKKPLPQGRYVFFAKKNATKITAPELREEIEQLLLNARALIV